MPKVLICGVFDLLHLGQIRTLKAAAALGEVTVGLLTDKLATEYKRKPILTYWERRATLLEFSFIHRVVEKDKHDIRDTIRQWEPDYLVIGSDWTPERFFELNGIDQAYLDLHEITLVIVPNQKILSTSKIIERVKASA